MEAIERLEGKGLEGKGEMLDSPINLDGNLYQTDHNGEDDQLVAITLEGGEDMGTIYQAMMMSNVLPKEAESKLSLDKQKEYKEGWEIQHTSEAGPGQIKHSSSSSSTDLSISQSSSSSSLNYKASACPAKPSDETNALDQGRYLPSTLNTASQSAICSQAPNTENMFEKNIHLAGSVNSNCYYAAVNEDLGCESNIDISRYISKVRNLKSRQHGLSEYGNSRKHEKQLKHSSTYVQYEHMPLLSEATCAKKEKDKLSELFGQSSYVSSSSVSQYSSKETFSMPSLGNQALLFSSLPLCNGESSFPSKKSGHSSIFSHPHRASVSSSEVAGKNCSRSMSCDNAAPDMKKYRYNQTAMALQQSGLMKTTIRTAELLRKSRMLQEELRKLRRETVFLVQSVLNNPENKHLKELDYNQLQTPTSNS